MISHQLLVHALADAFLRGAWTTDGLNERGCELLGRRWRWLRSLATRVTKHSFPVAGPRRVDLATFISVDAGFRRACARHELAIEHWLAGTPRMRPADRCQSWQLPAICTAGELADWLEVSTAELDWFADRRHLDYKDHRQRLSHYHYRPVSKRFGQVRLIEAPKARLKAIQRKLLTEILDLVPPHAAAQGFRRGTSICTFAAPHAGRRVVLRLDLRDFFPSIALAQVQALFRTIGYPEAVADLLAGLCSNATPCEVWNDCQPGLQPPPRKVRWRYARPHLPQGAPSSPALANLCAYRLDCRLAGLARAAGADYTRYADDLAFSGDEQFERRARRFQLHAAAIAMEEGFAVHHRKTRLMHRGVRQQLAGMVINQHLNLRRGDYDRLKAILTNCVRLGPDGQNRAGVDDFRRHLEGRVAFVQMLNPAKGKKLHAILQHVPW